MIFGKYVLIFAGIVWFVIVRIVWGWQRYSVAKNIPPSLFCQNIFGNWIMAGRKIAIPTTSWCIILVLSKFIPVFTRINYWFLTICIVWRWQRHTIDKNILSMFWQNFFGICIFSGKITCIIFAIVYYGNTGCWIFKGEIQNSKDCGELSNISLGIILVIKWFKNWCYQKMSITKNVLLNWYSSMKKKDSYGFWHRKLTLKVKFWHFLTARH